MLNNKKGISLIILVLIVVLVIVIGAVAIVSVTNSDKSSITDNTNTGGSSSAVNTNPTGNNSSTNSNISFTQSEKFLGYTISCPTNCSISNSSYGKCFSYGTNCSVIMEAPAAVGSVFTVTNLEDAVDKCEPYICKSLESRNTTLFHPNATIQSVTDSKKVTINGIQMLRTVGVFNNTRDNTKIDYVAYYMIATSSNGANYPIYIVGIPLEGSISPIEDFIDEMATHITK